IAAWFAMTPLGKKSASSFPSSAATRSSSRRVVGSPSRSSSPTSAAAIAARIAGVGLVTVSLRKSIGIAGIWRRPYSRRYHGRSDLRPFHFWNLDRCLFGADHGLIDDHRLRLGANDRRVDGVTARGHLRHVQRILSCLHRYVAGPF